MTTKVVCLLIAFVIGLTLVVVYIRSFNPTARASSRDDATRGTEGANTDVDAAIRQHSQQMIDQGRKTFRFDTFGSEAYWGDALKLHQAIEREKLGGVGPGVSPKTALSVGLKVDVDALPPALVEQLKAGKVNLDDPATTLALLKLNVVVGVTGFFNAQGNLQSMGIQCAFCHSTVNDSVVPGIGHRLDGWPNRDLNVGAIVALAPNLKPLTEPLGVDEAMVLVAILERKSVAPRRDVRRFSRRGLAVIGVHKLKIGTREQFFPGVAECSFPGRVEMFEVAINSSDTQQIQRQVDKLAQVV